MPHRHTRSRILLADDHATVRQSLRQLLEAESDFHVVAEAADGYQALDLALRLAPDIVLTDLRMPRLNGIDLTARLQEQAPEVVVVGLSMYDDAYFAQRMYQAGAFAYLDKAGQASVLFETLRAAAQVAGMGQHHHNTHATDSAPLGH